MGPLDSRWRGSGLSPNPNCHAGESPVTTSPATKPPPNSADSVMRCGAVTAWQSVGGGASSPETGVGAGCGVGVAVATTVGVGVPAVVVAQPVASTIMASGGGRSSYTRWYRVGWGGSPSPRSSFSLMEGLAPLVQAPPSSRGESTPLRRVQGNRPGLVNLVSITPVRKRPLWCRFGRRDRRANRHWAGWARPRARLNRVRERS
jgi:hypothetical protein